MTSVPTPTLPSNQPLTETRDHVSGSRNKLGSSFSIGGDQAEADPLLDEAFYVSKQFETVVNHDDPRCFIVGRTGTGKSAILRRLAEISSDKVIRIVPEDLAMPYITDLDVVARMDELGVDLSLFWKALWRHVMIVEVIRHRYKVDSPETKANMLQTLRDRLGRNAGKKQALAYLDEFEGKFWAETDERVREITTSLTKRIEASGEGAASAGFLSGSASASDSKEVTETERKELARRFQRIVNETQLARLSKMIEVLDDDVLPSRQDFTYIVIDDLDKDWVDSKLLNDLILALLKTVHDLKRVRNLKVLVALRTNIFAHLDFGSSSGGQEEKFRSLVLDLQWDRQNLTNMLNARVRVASRKQSAKYDAIVDLLPNQNPKRGMPLEYILDRTLLRPRDVISFVRECLAKSEGKGQISWDSIKRAEIPYSTNRLLALRDEWKLNYPGIDHVLEVFRGAPGRIDRDALASILDDCALVLSESSSSGSQWSEAAVRSVLHAGPRDTWVAKYGRLIRLLFSVGFLGASWEASRRPVFAIEDELAFARNTRLAEAEFFYVARMFHAALEIDIAAEP